MSKQSLIAYILCGALLLGICGGIGVVTNAVIDDMVETAAYELHEMNSGDNNTQNQEPVDSDPTDDTTVSTEPTDDNTVPTKPVDTDKPNGDETDSAVTDTESTVPDETLSDDIDSVETGPAETVPGETEGNPSDDTGDGEPSDKGDIEGNGPGDDFDNETPSDTETDSSKDVCDKNETNSDQTVVVLIAYTVQRGDTLNEIAAAHDVDPSVIANINNIKNINLIYVGEMFLIPVESFCCTCCELVS